jgi:hypothetical protein
LAARYLQNVLPRVKVALIKPLACIADFDAVKCSDLLSLGSSQKTENKAR